MPHITKEKKGCELPCTHDGAQHDEGENDGADFVQIPRMEFIMNRTPKLRKQDAARFDLILASLPDPAQETWEQSQVRKALLELRESFEQLEAESR